MMLRAAAARNSAAYERHAVSQVLPCYYIAVFITTYFTSLMFLPLDFRLMPPRHLFRRFASATPQRLMPLPAIGAAF